MFGCNKRIVGKQWIEMIATGKRPIIAPDYGNRAFEQKQGTRNNPVLERLQQFAHIVENPDQLAAIYKILKLEAGEVFTLIGPPGTGKTVLSVVVKWFLNSFGKRLHFVSKNNMGISSVCEKSINHGLDSKILRYANPLNPSVSNSDLKVSNYCTFKVYLPIWHDKIDSCAPRNGYFMTDSGQFDYFQPDFLQRFNIQPGASNKKWMRDNNLWMQNSRVLYIRYDWFSRSERGVLTNHDDPMNFRILNSPRDTTKSISMLIKK
ncbi:hypothetical protein RCL1_003839 [Eukaryota sp. TZLM3-RCL]